MFIMGIVLIAAGIFLVIYGGLLFRFALAVGLFVLGFSLASWLFAGQPEVTRILISLVVGGVSALIGYSLVRLVLHIAGGLLGAALVLVLLSLLPGMNSVISLILILAGAGVMGFFGSRLGDWVIILATTVLGSYAVVAGLLRLFPAAVGVTSAYTSALIPFTGPAFVVFLIILAIGLLAQHRFLRFKGRFVNR